MSMCKVFWQSCGFKESSPGFDFLKWPVLGGNKLTEVMKGLCIDMFPEHEIGGVGRDILPNYFSIFLGIKGRNSIVSCHVNYSLKLDKNDDFLMLITFRVSLSCTKRDSHISLAEKTWPWLIMEPLMQPWQPNLDLICINTNLICCQSNVTWDTLLL